MISGLNPSVIGGFSGICALMGVAATFVSAKMVKHLGILRVGSASYMFLVLVRNSVLLSFTVCV